MSPLALATHTTGPAAVRGVVMAREYRAFASLALTQRRLSHVARQRAREAEAEQQLDNYRYFAAEARRLWRSARWHLDRARDRKAALDG